jgi:thioredoxin reductase (NADPH)
VPAVVTADEIVGVSIFAPLARSSARRLSRVAADIRLVPGDTLYMRVTSGRCLAVLEGRLETDHASRRDRACCRRTSVGDLVGEVPIALGTPFPFGFRAAERRA